MQVSKQSAHLLISLLLRLDNKLSRGGVDDSDGTVGGFIEDVVQVLKEYEKLDPDYKEAFDELKDLKTCFSWEEQLLS